MVGGYYVLLLLGYYMHQYVFEQLRNWRQKYWYHNRGQTERALEDGKVNLQEEIYLLPATVLICHPGQFSLSMSFVFFVLIKVYWGDS